MKHFPLLLALLLTLSGCFELKEKVYVRKDGSGHFRLEVDLSAHRDMLNELLFASDGAPYPTFGEKQLDELLQVWKDGAEEMNTINGITGAKHFFNRDSMQLGMVFDFADIQALNLALALKEHPSNGFQPAYSFEKGKFTKNNVFSFYNLIEKLQPSAQNLSDEGLEMQKKTIFAQIRYSCRLEVAGKVKKYTNKNFARTGGAMQLSLDFASIQGGKANIGNEVRFK